MRAMVIVLAVMLTGCASHWVKQEEMGTTLYLKAPDASEVAFYCSLDGYAPRRADEIRKGVWRVVLPEDEACRYFYRVDEEMVVPPCKQREFDDFGGENCLYSPMAWGRGGDQ